MNFNYVSFESILIIFHEMNIIVTHPTTFVHFFRVLFFFLGHIVKAFQNKFAFIISTETCFWLKRESDRTLAVFSSLETRFNTHNQIAIRNAFRNAFLELSRLSSISQYREYEECQECFHCGAALRNFIRNTMYLNTFQNSFAFITSTEACFWLKRVQIALFSAFQKGVSNPIIKTALRLSSAKITLKVVWKP